MEALLLRWDQWGAKPLAHTIASALAAYGVCIWRLLPHLLLQCLLLPDRFSPFGLQAPFPFLTPAVTRRVIASKIIFAGWPAGLKRKPTFRGRKGLAEWPGGDRFQCLARSADPLHKWISFTRTLLSCPVQTAKAYIIADWEPLTTGKFKIL